MRLLCVQCMQVNQVSDSDPPGADGKVRVKCPACGFTTVITRKSAGVAATKKDSKAKRSSSAAVETEEITGKTKTPPVEGEWMIRRLDGTESGPLTFIQIREMIASSELGKIDEVRKLDERYVPAAFHETISELFNELETAEVERKPDT